MDELSATCLSARRQREAGCIMLGKIVTFRTEARRRTGLVAHVEPRRRLRRRRLLVRHRRRRDVTTGLRPASITSAEVRLRRRRWIAACRRGGNDWRRPEYGTERSLLVREAALAVAVLGGRLRRGATRIVRARVAVCAERRPTVGVITVTGVVVDGRGFVCGGVCGASAGEVRCRRGRG